MGAGRPVGPTIPPMRFSAASPPPPPPLPDGPRRWGWFGVCILVRTAWAVAVFLALDDTAWCDAHRSALRWSLFATGLVVGAGFVWARIHHNPGLFDGDRRRREAAAHAKAALAAGLTNAAKAAHAKATPVDPWWHTARLVHAVLYGFVLPLLVTAVFPGRHLCHDPDAPPAVSGLLVGDVTFGWGWAVYRHCRRRAAAAPRRYTTVGHNT